MVRTRASRDEDPERLELPEISPADQTKLDELLATEVVIDDKLDELLERDAELNRLLDDVG
jgi:hypothetical protein